MITLYQFPPRFGLLNVSPFCMKVETYLRLTKLPYQVVNTIKLSTTPKGKLPYIVDNDHVIADSDFIIQYLKATYGNPLDAHLNTQQMTEALLMKRMIEEHYYWTIAYSRWLDPFNVQQVNQLFFSRLPFILRPIIAYSIRKKARANLIGHGMGRHSRDEVYLLGIEDLTALKNYLADKPYIMGDQVTSLDACIYAFLASTMRTPIASPLSKFANEQVKFVEYLKRMDGLVGVTS